MPNVEAVVGDVRRMKSVVAAANYHITALLSRPN